MVIAETVVELTAEAGAAATGVGTIPAILAALGSALKSSAVIAALVAGVPVAVAVAVAVAVEKTIDGCTSLQSKLKDDSKFRHGNWPDPGRYAYLTPTPPRKTPSDRRRTTNTSPLMSQDP